MNFDHFNQSPHCWGGVSSRTWCDAYYSTPFSWLPAGALLFFCRASRWLHWAIIKIQELKFCQNNKYWINLNISKMNNLPLFLVHYSHCSIFQSQCSSCWTPLSSWFYTSWLIVYFVWVYTQRKVRWICQIILNGKENK